VDLIRPPAAALRPFVQCLWFKQAVPSPAQRERVLPTGTMHIAFRLAPEPLRVYRSDHDPHGRPRRKRLQPARIHCPVPA